MRGKRGPAVSAGVHGCRVVKPESVRAERCEKVTRKSARLRDRLRIRGVAKYLAVFAKTQTGKSAPERGEVCASLCGKEPRRALKTENSYEHQRARREQRGIREAFRGIFHSRPQAKAVAQTTPKSRVLLNRNQRTIRLAGKPARVR